MSQKRPRSRLRIVAAVLGAMLLVGSAGAGVVYWQMFRKDPRFLEQKAESDRTQHALDNIFDEEQ